MAAAALAGGPLKPDSGLSRDSRLACEPDLAQQNAFLSPVREKREKGAPVVIRATLGVGGGPSGVSSDVSKNATHGAPQV